MSPGVLNVYIEHDGQPWKQGGQVPAADPTPQRPVMAQLMRLDTAPRLLLGRPCHHGLAASQHCDALVWTHARYSDAVVESMAAALHAHIALTGAHAVRLFGHSGGGTLAVLLAYRVPQVRAVITLAGNLSVSQWAALHGYSPLAGSLDPATLPPLPGSIHQMHFVGAQDRNTTPALLQAYIRSHPHATVRVLEDVDHLCCWARHWPTILAGLPPAGQ